MKNMEYSEQEVFDSMIHEDTIKLMRECDAGIKMGVSAIDDVIDRIKDNSLEDLLTKSRREHLALADELEKLLEEFHDDGKEPNPIASAMSSMKISMKLMADPSDGKIADLMSDGLAIGIKSLSRYLNQYQAADERSKEIAKRLILIEDRLEHEIRAYL